MPALMFVTVAEAFGIVHCLECGQTSLADLIFDIPNLIETISKSVTILTGR